MTKVEVKDKVKVSWRPCACGNHCLGPLTFHPGVKGRHVELSAGDRRATRDRQSFRHGVTFSNRPLQVGEKVRLRVERCVAGWHGALRLGFTCVPPGSGPMCSLAIPDLTARPGFWAIPVPDSYCTPRTELTFWVSHGGFLRIQSDDGFEQKEKMLQIDTSKPIWAMMDLYGQTTGVFLLGSEKKTLFCKRRSCPADEGAAEEENCGYDQIPDVILKRMSFQSSSGQNNADVRLQGLSDEESCVVCVSQTACVLLDCGHCCLCSQCATRVIRDFGTCPLCRQSIRK